MAFRCSPAAAPGALMKVATPKKAKQLGREPRQKDVGHLDLCRQLPCIVCGIENQTEAAHIRFSSAQNGKSNPGIGAKPNDSFVVPLCGIHHREQHAAGNEKEWWASTNIDPIKAATALYRISGDHEAMTQVVRLFRAASVIEANDND